MIGSAASGFTCAIAQVTSTVYILEIASTESRGLYSAVRDIMYMVGVLTGRDAERTAREKVYIYNVSILLVLGR